MSGATKRTLNVCTVGHEGHGKTTLTAALSRVCSADFGSAKVEFDTVNNAPDEKCGAVTFKAAHVKYDSKQCHLAHIDCPRSSDYVKGFISGGIKVDVAILVCSAVGGMQSQTHEHILLCGHVGVPYVIVFLNKAEMVGEADDQEFYEQEIREKLIAAGFPGDDTLIIKGSAFMALEGKDDNQMGTTAVKKLLEALDSHTPTVATADKTLPQPHTQFEAMIYLLSKEEGGVFTAIQNYYKPKFNFLTSEVTGQLRLPAEKTMAGDNTVVDVTLSQAIAMEKGQNFTITESGLAIGRGIVLNIIK
ncbi:GTP-binding protein [Pseudomonas viridiflava]|uniref:GTP-binding protein n=1 Tax=Pseudomonas viridiflava TaxID=33069 RepID=UPI00177BD638|nr:GTP-binding protein [Pseudomonas viridiflava]MBD8200872.1 elongation factor Tu [Pseudomonas viridiflava]